MGRRGKNNGTVYSTCPFCGIRTGRCNLMGRIKPPEGFPEDIVKTPHTIKCWEERSESD